ncbi:MAG: hypothetical protein GC168_18750 [Candidatus Hydrogenedens sp.]|nr:hypothetical protein [Candidatus Hydrogenedens sp.]
MDVAHLSVVLAVVIAKALSILAILYIPMLIGARWLPRIDDQGLYLQPAAWFLALFSGAVGGGALLYCNLDPNYFTVNEIFRPDGPWALSYSAFILERVNPFNYSFDPVFNQMAWDGEGTNLAVLFVLAAASAALLVLKAISTWRSAGALRGIIFGFAVVVWACYLTMFLVCLTLWLLHLLNFWTLALATLAVHLHRSRSFPFHLSTLLAPVFGAASDHGHHGGGHGHGDHHPLPEDEEEEVDIPTGLTQSLS